MHWIHKNGPTRSFMFFLTILLCFFFLITSIPFEFSSLSGWYYTMEFFLFFLQRILWPSWCLFLPTFTHAHTYTSHANRTLLKIVHQLFGRRVRQPVHNGLYIWWLANFPKILSMFQRNDFGASLRELIWHFFLHLDSTLCLLQCFFSGFFLSVCLPDIFPAREHEHSATLRLTHVCVNFHA